MSTFVSVSAEARVFNSSMAQPALRSYSTSALLLIERRIPVVPTFQMFQS
jgi:hypothetical protein